MNKLKVIFWIVLCSTILIVGKSTAQTKDELQQRKKQTEQNINVTNDLLKQTEQSKSLGLNKLLILKKRISLREQLIQEISTEISLLDKNIEENQVEIKKLQNEVVELKEEYAKMIYYAYKNRNSYDKLMFILAAEDFNQAYRRMKYFQQYSEYRKKQSQQIIEAQKNLEYNTEQLSEKRQEKISLLSRKELENNQLTNERSRKNKEITRLKRKEKELRKKVREEEKRKKQIEKAIAELIERELREKNNLETLSANEEVLSKRFKGSKGKIKWPLNKSVIIQEFGEHPHPVIKGVVSKNDGINIGSSTDEKVKAIFDGEVKKVFAVPGANMGIIVRHGHYLSLYTNIVNVRVKPGDFVSEGDYLGDVYSSNGSDGNLLHLRIYQEKKVLNPKNWLRKQ